MPLRARLATALALAASAVILPVTAGQAATKACQPLILDARGDTSPGMAPVAPDRPDLDILAADLGASGDILIVTVGMASPPAQAVPASLIDVIFDIGSTTYNAYKYTGADGTIYGFNNATGGHVVTGTTDSRSGLVRIRVPRHLIPASARATVRDVGAHTEELVGTNAIAIGHFRDSATSRLSSRVGTRGCL